MEMRDRASRGGMAAYVRRLINHCVHATPGGARLSRAPQRPLHTALLIDLAARQGLSAAELESLIDNPARCVSEALHYLLQAAQEEAGTDDSRGTDAPSAAADRQDSNDNSPGWSIPGHFSVETVDLDAELDAEIRAHRRRNSSRG
jgi:hypothetical protein